jgi:ornithine cyclodeaminase/alanine dehydrogenase-like protein (mu-crystallin family)
LPGHQALICLFDAETGSPLVIMDGTYVTAIRTAGGAALATRLLARPDARVLAIVGAGVQGRSHLAILPRVRDVAEIRIVSREHADAERLAATNPRARAVASFAEAVHGADIICLCTTSGTPVIERDWLKPGAHVTSVGYFPPHGELPRAVIEGGRLFVETRLAFDPPPAGCGELAGLDPALGTELGQVILGLRPGRTTSDELTVYKSMGHAVEDLVAASLAYRRALETGVGQAVSLTSDS